jgi:tripartite-type tricarboxylate transporter receptor subunit TctC
MRTVSIALLTLLGFSATPGLAQSVQQFYKGRQVTLIVGFNPGGASDPYARIVAQHLPRFLAGAPTIVVRNMPGAGSVRAANYLHNDAPKDGSELGLIAASTALEPLFGLRIVNASLGWGAPTVNPGSASHGTPRWSRRPVTCLAGG